MGKKHYANLTLSIALIILVGIFGVSSICFADDLIIEDYEIHDQFREGRVPSSKVKIGYSNGGPSTYKHQIASASPYPKDAVLEVEASLAVESGYYEIEFFHQGRRSFVLAARPGKPAKGKGKVDVTSDGEYMEYRITAKSAANVLYSFTINSLTNK